MTEFVMGMIGSRPVEWLAVFCGLLNVGLIMRRSLWNYPFGIVMVILYFFIFWDYHLYSDALLQVFFLGIHIYGVYAWLGGRMADGRVAVSSMPYRSLLKHLVVATVAWLVIGYLMQRYTDAAAPFWDAAIAALSMMAQYLTTRRKLESWYFWIAVDVLAIGLFYSRGLIPTSALYSVFLLMAITGYFKWRQAPKDGVPA